VIRIIVVQRNQIDNYQYKNQIDLIVLIILYRLLLKLLIKLTLSLETIIKFQKVMINYHLKRLYSIIHKVKVDLITKQ
jgi:hypothetical protein